MQNLEDVLESGNLDAEKVKTACKAAENIFHWVLAVRNYYFVYKTTEPLRNKMILADVQLIKLKKEENSNTDIIDRLKVELEGIRKLHHAKDREVKEFQSEIDSVFLMKSKAARLLNELAGEKQKWQVCEDVANEQLLNIEGDCLLAAAMINYLAPFTQKFRTKLYTKWTSEIKALGIHVSSEANFTSLFSEPLVIKTWLENGLPNDSFSIQNAVILDQT